MSAVPLLEQSLNTQLQSKLADTTNMNHIVVLYYCSTRIWLIV